MADITLSSVVGQPRRKIITLTASDAAVAIPSWAQGGKGRIIVTGTGPGGSGGIISTATASNRAGGAGAGGFVIDLRLLIPSGVTTLAVALGTPGAAVTASAATAGNPGGTTTVTIGSVVVTLEGGLGGTNSATAGLGGRAYLGSTTNISVALTSAPFTDPSQREGLLSGGSPFMGGAPGAAGNQATQGYGAGAWGIWGPGGPGIAGGVTGVMNGGDGTGYGSGGAGANDYATTSNATSGAGAPSFVTLEFVEGF